MKGISFKTDRQKHDFQFMDAMLKVVVIALALYVWWTFKRRIVITCVYRTPKENMRDGGKLLSAHLKYRAVDIRSRNFTKNELHFIEVWLLKTFGDMLYVNISDHGTGAHIHVNLRWNYLKKLGGK